MVEEGKAAVRRIVTGGENGANVVVKEGLKAGEQVIVEGIQSLRPAMPVQASPITAAVTRG